MPSFYFRKISDGSKAVAHSLQDIGRMAQREADKFGQAIQIYSEGGQKSHRKLSMAKNPGGKYFLFYASPRGVWKAEGASEKPTLLRVRKRDYEHRTGLEAAIVQAPNLMAAYDKIETGKHRTMKKNPANRPYWVIYVRFNGKWWPQFGDYDNEAVKQEVEDTYKRQPGYGYKDDGKYAAKDIKVIKFAKLPSQPETMDRSMTL